MNKTYLPPQNSLERGGTWWYRSTPRSASQRDCHAPERNKPEYTPHMDTGFVIVVNADKVSDWEKTHRSSTVVGRPGGMKMETFAHLARLPERIVEQAVKGMLPKNSWGGNCSPSLKFMLESSSHQAQNLKS